MSKELSEMSLKELWELFPIRLTEHKDFWADWYREEEKQLRQVLPDNVKLHHIGSTAINGIWAKPIIDILAEADIRDLDTIKNTLPNCGYICMAQTENRVDFNKGYTSDGFAERVFHLHLRSFGDNGELYFRDYLNEYPEIAGEYEKLKLSLRKRFEHDRDGYTESKTAFVREYTQKAIERYGKDTVMDNKERIKYFLEYIVSDNLVGRVAEYVSETCTVRIGENIAPVGVDGMIQHMIAVRKTYPDYKMTVNRQYSDGDYVISEFVMEGTHMGEWLGMKPTGKKLCITGVDIDKVVGGKIVEHGGAANTFEALFDAGIICPAP